MKAGEMSAAYVACDGTKYVYQGESALRSEDPAGKLIALLKPRSPAAEAFRSLRSNLHFVTAPGRVQTIMLTSATTGEGKSLVTANLAVVMAQSAKRVLVVDCDIRRPTQHLYLGTRQLPGLTSFLVDGVPVEEAIIPTRVPNLWLMPSGPLPPNPSELLDSQQMRGLWEQLTPRYDQILVDTPPLLVVTDGAVLAGQVDGVIFVVDAGETRAEAAKEAKQVLASAGGRVIGAVLNQVKDGQGRYYYRYHHRYYDESERSTS